MLSTYNKKRDFKQTKEPQGKTSKAAGAKKLSFVVQRHDASRLHYDFRLQLDGVLKSWAVPKGPSLNPSDKRLAVMVEDHPFEYRKFYGTIPEGNYGAGEVEIWDEGLYYPINEEHNVISQSEALKNLNNGELKVLLAGTHLQGEFVLVQMKKDDKNWLLIKHDDDYAVHKKYHIEKVESIKKKTARATKTASKTASAKKAATKKAATKKAVAKKTGAKKAATKPSAKKATAKKTAASSKSSSKSSKASNTREKDNTTLASITEITASILKKSSDIKDIKPMLASTAEETFDNDEWIFETKWDGYRCLASVIEGDVQIWSRNSLSFNKKFPAIVEALQKSIHHHVVLDGEVIALENGKTSFQALQHAGETNPELQYCVFDLLWLDGHSLTKFPLTDRKLLLEKLLKENNSPAIRYSEHIAAKGIAFFKKAQKQALEGIMAKKADSLYAPGARSKQWLKIKNRNDREAIIVGFTKPSGSRKHFGALILAEKKGKGYKYIGHTGTGFSDDTLASLYKTMKPLIKDDSPFDNAIKVNAPVTWLQPKLVCQVFYTEQTKSGLLRHPVYAGLRTDKKATEVKADPVVEVPDDSSIPSVTGNNIQKQKKEAMPTQKTNSKKPAEIIEETEEMADQGSLTIDRKKVPVSNPTKIYFPEKGITKGDVIAYYHSVAKLILPHVKNRPMSLKRNPNGIHGDSFFQKNAGENAPSWIKTYDNFSESSDRNIEYILCNNTATLIYLANLGCIEMNPWLATYNKPEHPTWIVIDLDPSSKNSFEQVIDTAKAVKEVTDKAGLKAYLKTSGASGLHVYIPFGGRYSYDTLKPFCELIAHLAHELVPDFTSLERSLKKRGNKIYVDYLQNRRGQTLACAYSLRPVEVASISTPLEWKELKKGLHPSQFNIFNIHKRIDAKGDLFQEVLTTKNDLRKAMKALE